MASTSDIAKRYFAALSAHDLDAATACWKPGAIDRFVGGQDLVAPDGVRAYFGELFAEVIELPGQAPGQIGLALIPDTVYTIDIQTGCKGGPRVPHPAFVVDVEQARASIRKLAALGPEQAWTGHADPVTGDARRQLERAAEAS